MKKKFSKQMKIIILENNFLFEIISSISHFKKGAWASFVVQWLRIHLAIHRTTAIFLVQEDLACHRAAKPVATSTEPVTTLGEPAL